MITPGPYRIIEERPSGVRVVGIYGITIAWFGSASVVGKEGSHAISYDECQDNAQQLLDSLMQKQRFIKTQFKALRNLRRVRKVLTWNTMPIAERIQDAVAIIDGRDA